MWRKILAKRVLFLFLMLLFGNVPGFAQMAAKDDNGSWSQSYKDYRKIIKPLTPRAKASCEKILKDILADLDAKNKCSTDSHCSLIDQDPFGATIPIRAEDAHDLQMQTKKFREGCDDGTIRSIRNDNIENEPVCWKNTCSVKTRLKKL